MYKRKISHLMLFIFTVALIVCVQSQTAKCESNPSPTAFSIEANIGNALVIGNDKALKKVIVIYSPDCTFSAKYHQEIKKVVEKRKDIVIYVKLFPLPLQKDAYWKAKSIMCNRSLQMLDDNFEKKSIPRTECDTKEPNATIDLAKSVGVQGTPTTIFPNGKVEGGFRSAEELISLIDANSDQQSDPISLSSPRDFFIRGLDFAKKAQYEKAILDFSKAIELDPKYGKAYMNRGVAYTKSGKSDKAAADFAQCCNIGFKKGCEASMQFIMGKSLNFSE